MSKIILLVEDEEDLAESLEYNLHQEGYTVRVAHNGKDALELASKNPIPDLALLDLMLPDMSGFEICRRLKADKKLQNISIIMVTAKGEEIDRVVGFEVGADDYVVKPFSARELMLRVRAVLRRSAGDVSSDANRVSFGPFLLDQSAHRVWIFQQEITLTALEFKLLTMLLVRRGKVLTREVLLAEVWNMDPNVNTRTVDKHVQRLRKKIGPASNYIETIRGVGYRCQTEE